MASFQKYTTKDGIRWMYKYYSTIDPATGKKRQSTKRGFKTKKEAQLDAAKIEQEIANGTYITEDKYVTFEQVYRQWFETISNTYKPSTRKAVVSKFKKRILPHFGNLRMKDINSMYCQEVINQIAKEIKSVENMKMYVNQIFEYAISKEIIAHNPIKGVIIPKDKNEFIIDEGQLEERNFWDKTEIKQFLNILKDEYPLQDYVLFHSLIYTGARKGEILSLRRKDIDFKAKTINLNKTLFFENGKHMSLTSKTAASRRLISTDDTTLSLIKKLHTERNRASVVNLSFDNNEYLFIRNDGSPLRLAYPNDKLEEIIRVHDLHPITVHGLRHTHASLLFEAGASIKEVQERLGHTDIKMTMNIYTHVTRTVKEQTAAKFATFMNEL